MSMTQSTKSANEATVKRDWYVIDATDQVLGRLATQIADRLRGKHKTEYTPHVDTGDYLIVINAGKVRVTGTKPQKKIYHHHTGYPGGIKDINFEKLVVKDPERIIKAAVKRMMPTGPLANAMFAKLKIYPGSEHPHTAQQPKPLTL